MGLSLTDLRKKLFGTNTPQQGIQSAPTAANITRSIATAPTTDKGFAYQTRNDPIIQAVTPVAELGRDLVKSTYKTAVGTPVEAGRAALAAVTNNTKARQAAVSRLKGNIGTGLDMARALPISLYQLGESVNPVGGDVYQREHTFSDPVAKFVFGDKPIPSMQKQYKQNVQEKGKVYAGSALGLTALMDAVALKGAAKGAQNLTKGSFETPQPSAPVETKPTVVVKNSQETVKAPIKAKSGTKQIVAKVDVPADPLTALKQEALKYKSAEEFVNSQANLLHGTKADFTEFDPSLLGTNTGAPSAKKGFFFTDTPEIANHYANPGRNYGTAVSKNLEDSFKNIEARAKAEGLSNSLENNSGAALVVGAWPKVEPGTPKELVIKAVLDKMDSLKTRFDSPQDIAKIERFKQIATEELNKTPITELELFGKVMKSKVDFKNPLVFDDNGFRNGKSYAQRIDEAIEKGHDGVIIKNSQDPLRGNIYVALNKDQILTEAQLTDLYNQAHAEAKVSKAKITSKSPQQRKTVQQIHIIKKQQNMADTEYRALLKDVTGKTSTKDMSQAELNKVVTSMGGTVKGTAPRRASIVEGPNAAQRLFEGTRELIGRHYGDNGKVIADKIHSVREQRDVLSQHFYNQIQKAMSLSKDDFKTMVMGLDDLDNGKNVKAAPHIIEAIKEWQNNIQKIQRAAVAVGLPANDKGKNYFPHTYKEVLTARGRKSFAQRMVDAGEATDIQDAIRRISFMRERYNKPFGHLEKERTSNLPGYEMTQEALHDYISKAFDRIVRAKEFGANDEILNKLISQLDNEGYDVGPHSTFSKSLNTALGNNDYTTISHKLSRGARTVNAYRSLSLSALTNGGQWVNTATFTGIKRTILAMHKDKEAHEFVKNSAVLIDHTIDDIAKGMLGTNGKIAENIASPFFQSIEKFNRATAAVSGRDMARDMAARAAKGDKNAELVLRKKLGVTGEIKEKLTYEQEIQAARATVEKTQFKVDPQDLPAIADTALGKVAFQFKTFGYKQTAFMYQEVLREAARGNFAPLARFVITGVPTGVAVATIKGAIRGKLPYSQDDFKDPKKAAQAAFEALQSVGAFGLPGQEINNAINNFTYNDAGSAGIATAAGILAGPTGSGITELASNIDKAQNGNSQPLKKQGIRSIPLVGSTLAARLYPSKATAETKRYFDALNAAGHSLRGQEDRKTKAKFEEIITKSKNPENGKTIQSSPAESLETARSLLTDDKLRATYVKFQKDSGDHAPSWDLPDEELKLFLKYKAQYTGSDEKTAVRDEFAQKYGDTALKDIQNADDAFYKNLKPVEGGKGYEANKLTPKYPEFGDQVTQLMEVYYDADSATKSQLMNEYGPTITDYMSQMAQYTKEMRKVEGAPELKDYPTADPATQKIIDTYNTLPKGDGSRSAWIRSNPDAYKQMQSYLTQSSMYSLMKNAAVAQFANEDPSQKLLKEIYNVGKYDITKSTDASGNTVYSVGSGGGSGSGSSGNNEIKYLGNSERLRISAPKGKVREASLNLKAGTLTPKKYKVNKKVLPTKKKVALKKSKV